MEHLVIFQVSACGARGHVRWIYSDARWINFDAVFFFCIVGIPLIPLRAAHVFRYRPSGPFQRDYEWIPIRWSLGLLMLAWLRRATLVAAIYAFPLALFAVGAIYAKNDPDGWSLLGMCLGSWAAFPLVWIAAWLLDRTNRSRRRIMGDWRWGSSDPMTYRASWIAMSDFATPRPNYNADTYTEAAENCIRIHNWWGGMWASRMVQRFEDPTLGRELVDRILNDDEVQEALIEVKQDATRWHELLGPGRYGG